MQLLLNETEQRLQVLFCHIYSVIWHQKAFKLGDLRAGAGIKPTTFCVLSRHLNQFLPRQILWFFSVGVFAVPESICLSLIVTLLVGKLFLSCSCIYSISLWIEQPITCVFYICPHTGCMVLFPTYLLSVLDTPLQSVKLLFFMEFFISFEIMIMIISSFCNARLMNPLSSLGAAVWKPQCTNRQLNLR